MPSKAVPRTVGDFILYYYAKLVIAPSAGETGNYRFIMDRYKRLKSGEIQISSYDREIEKLAQQPGVCVFCGKQGKTVLTEVVPRKLGGPVGIHNLVHACQRCADSKGDKNLLDWWCNILGRDIEDLPRIPAGLFLKLAYEKHCVGFGLRRRCEDICHIWHGDQGS
ncbi:MAG: HNH endonuclease [candidate division KSB1 bacterium]|nr:HNH endonuclease [candidate division KSB1 bacterium]MDZ7399686.1 HNH endonuclease [candidate division KSB1 bacterium]